ncbi:hypothetical protein Bbelb_421500 [Branchiostoma belcheri]|nr:hypothetical protein Bbelb_421500 [Branchiostoma belcheri]
MRAAHLSVVLTLRPPYSPSRRMTIMRRTNHSTRYKTIRWWGELREPGELKQTKSQKAGQMMTSQTSPHRRRITDIVTFAICFNKMAGVSKSPPDPAEIQVRSPEASIILSVLRRAQRRRPGHWHPKKSDVHIGGKMHITRSFDFN